MRKRFAAAGWPEEALVGWEYDWRADNRETARRLAAEVERVLAETGADRVDLVGHSMGALPARWYLARLDGTARVDAFASLAAPNAGSIRGFTCDHPSCHDRRWGSALVEALNRGDTTPGAVRYGAWWSPCDEVLVPDTTALLPGALNTRTACLGHEALLADAQVIREVLRFVAPTNRSGGT
jgi:triacylglycerol lipase